MANVKVRHYKKKSGDVHYYLVVREPGSKEYSIQLGAVGAREAKRRRSEVVSEIYNSEAGQVKNSTIPFKQFAEDKFIKEWAMSNRSKETVKSYRLGIKQFDKAYPRIRISAVTRYHIEKWLNELNHLDPHTRNLRLYAVKKVFEKAVDWSYLKRSPAESIKGEREHQKEKKALSLSQYDKLWEVLTPWQKCYVGLMIQTGLRPKEVSQLKLEDIDWDRNRLKVISNASRSTKTKKTRYIPIKAELKEMLEILKENRPQINFDKKTNCKAYVPRETPEQRVYLFCHKNGKPVLSVRKSFKNAVREAGIEENFSPHSLRHTFASFLADKNVHPKKAQKLLGHSTIKTTMDIYTHFETDQLVDAIDSLPTPRPMRDKLQVIPGGQ